jgi:ATP-binding protein involved in chromosome partitioning
MDALFAAVAKAAPLSNPARHMFQRPPPAGNVVAVCSGKGGVGKSTVALNLAVSLAAEGLGVGLLDADVYGPDIPLMVGLKRTKPATSWQLARAGGLDHTPLEAVEAYGVRLMSSGFIISEDQALTWNADLIGLFLNQLIWSTVWGKLDYLIIDLPPGTSDVVQDIFRVIPGAMAVIVVSPQDVAHLDNRRVVAALRRSGIRLLGGIENMKGLRCPSCDAHIELFAPTAPERSIWAGGLPLLGSVPWSPTVGEPVAEPVVVTAPESNRGNALREIAGKLRAAVEDQ